MTLHCTFGSPTSFRSSTALSGGAGYNVTCPFLPPGLEVVREDRPELLLNVAHPRDGRLFFLGFVQAHGPMIPCVESQMGLVADLIQVPKSAP